MVVDLRRMVFRFRVSEEIVIPVGGFDSRFPVVYMVRQVFRNASAMAGQPGLIHRNQGGCLAAHVGSALSGVLMLVYTAGCRPGAVFR
jgi:hypothetical protein